MSTSKVSIDVTRTRFPTDPRLLADLLAVAFCPVRLNLGCRPPGRCVRPRPSSHKSCWISLELRMQPKEAGAGAGLPRQV